MLYNERSIKKVLTCLYLDNDLIISPDYPLRLNDFALKKYQAIYSALYNLYSLGNNRIDHRIFSTTKYNVSKVR